MPPSPAKTPAAPLPPPPKRKSLPAAATKTPTAATRSATVETAPAPAAAAAARPIKYPLLAVDTFTGASAMTEALVKKLIGWETEAEFGARMGRATGTAPSAWKFTDAVRDTTTGKSIEFVVDMDGNKAVMWHNTENRPLDLTWCKSLAEGEILERHWAGELTVAGTELLREAGRLLEDIDAVANRVKRVATGWEPQLTIAVDSIIAKATVMEL